MATLSGVDPKTATAEQTAMLAMLPPGGLTPYIAHVPGIAEAMMRVGIALFDEDVAGLPGVVREASTLRIARQLDAAYVEEQHMKLAVALGLDPDVARAIVEGSAADELPSPWRSALRLVEESLCGRPVPPEDLATCTEAFGAGGVVSLAATMGLTVFMSVVARWADLEA